jgi:hypothetical protein
MLAGAAKGSVSATAGIGGDIESLGRGALSAVRAPSGQRLEAFSQGMEQPTVLPTTEDVSSYLPAVVPTTAPLSRQHSAGYGQTMGEFIPTPGSGRVVQGGLNAIKSIPAAVQHGAQEFAKASAMGVPHVVKPKGGNWFGNRAEKEINTLKKDKMAAEDLEEMKRVYPPDVLETMSPETRVSVDRAFPHLEKEVALNNWVDRNLTNYVKKEMATPEDPVRKLAEQGITHFPIAGEPSYWARHGQSARQDFGGTQMAESPLAKQWENRTDSMIMRDTAQQHQDMMHLAPGMYSDRDEWIKKLAPETPLYSAQQNRFSSLDLGFDHIIDVLREDLTAGRIRPEQLNKVSMEQAVRRTYEYDQELAKKMAEARIAAREGLPVHKEYPEGYRWVELNKPGAFASESEAMGHSVRGYEPPKGHPDWIEGSGERGSLGYGHGGWEGIKRGRAKVYSLVDAKGEPHVTVEVGRKYLDRGFRGNERPPEDLYYPLQEKYVKGQESGEIDPNLSFAEWWRKENNIPEPELPFEITQIKGKQNAAPKEEYLPYVQDFVRSSGMPVKNDLHHTGLHRIEEKSDIPGFEEWMRLKALGNVPTIPPGYYTPQELLQFGEQSGLKETHPGVHNVWMKKLGLNPDEGMKRGGKVSVSDNPDTMMIDVEDKRYDKGGEVKATPRSEGWGMAADLVKAIENASKEQFGLKNPATEEIANFLMIPELARTLERKAYGQPITNIGKANVPLIPEDTSGALEAVAPLTGVARKGAKALGKAAASEVEKAMFGESRVGALNAMTPQVMSVYKPHTPLKPDPEVGSRYKTEHVGNLAPKKEFNIEKEQGSSVMSNPWDLTSRGEKVIEVSDVPLINQIVTEGGHDFARDLGHIDANIGGASGEQIAQRMQDRVNDAYFANMLEKGTGRVFTMPSTMDITASNYSTMPVDIVMDLLSQAGLKSKDLNRITNDIKTFMFEGEKGKFKNVAPVGSPEFLKQLREGGDGFSAGDLRKGVMDRLSKSEYQKMIGFNIEDVYGAIHDPTLKGYPKGFVGNTMIETVPFADLSKAKHQSYDTANAGKYAGSMPSMPLELMMPDLYQYFEAKYLSDPKYQKLTPNQLRTTIVNTIEKKGSVISQPINQRVVDNVMRYKEGLKQGHFDPKDYNAVMDFMRRTGGYKEGGEVHESGGGAISKAALTAMERLKELKAEAALKSDVWKAKQAADESKYTQDIQPLTPEMMRAEIERMQNPVKKASGGEITADDLTIEERPL